METKNAVRDTVMRPPLRMLWKPVPKVRHELETEGEKKSSAGQFLPLMPP